MDNGLAKTNRIVVIDSLRGFAIAAVFLIHTSNHFLSGIFPVESDTFWEEIDNFLRSSLYFLFENKAFSIFALFFGFTFALQRGRYGVARVNDRGKRVRFETFMVKRTILLVLFGILNAAFFAGGDPLVFYALTMFLVIPLGGLKVKYLKILAFILLLQPIDVIHSYFPLWEDTYIAEYVKLSEVLQKGDFLDTVLANVTYGLKGCLLWALQMGRFTQTLGLFLLGVVAYRQNWFVYTYSWSKRWLLFVVVTVAMYFVKEHLLSFTVMYYNLAFTASLIAIYVRLFEKFGNIGIFKVLGMYGKMSLTNFVGQSILGALLYYPWALNLAPKLGVSASLAITLLLIALQILCSNLWLKKHKKGLLENLWSKLTALWV